MGRIADLPLGGTKNTSEPVSCCRDRAAQPCHGQRPLGSQNEPEEVHPHGHVTIRRPRHRVRAPWLDTQYQLLKGLQPMGDKLDYGDG